MNPLIPISFSKLQIAKRCPYEFYYKYILSTPEPIADLPENTYWYRVLRRGLALSIRLNDLNSLYSALNTALTVKYDTIKATVSNMSEEDIQKYQFSKLKSTKKVVYSYLCKQEYQKVHKLKQASERVFKFIRETIVTADNLIVAPNVSIAVSENGDYISNFFDKNVYLRGELPIIMVEKKPKENKGRIILFSSKPPSQHDMKLKHRGMAYLLWVYRGKPKDYTVEIVNLTLAIEEAVIKQSVLYTLTPSEDNYLGELKEKLRVVYNKKIKAWFTPNESEELGYSINRERLKNQTIESKPRFCKYCPYKNICEYIKHIQGGEQHVKK